MKLIGIDVGGTNTRVRVRSLEHDAEVTTSLKTNEWLTPNGLADTVSVRNLLRVASDAGANRRDSLAIGAHGCDSLIQIRGFTNSLRQQHDGPLKVVNDADLLAPAAGITAAIGVIAGTGSIVTGRTHDGESITAGGHGWMIGDPGSAPGITREAVLATLDQADRGAIPDQLAHRLMDYYGVSDVADLPAAFAREARQFTFGPGRHLLSSKRQKQGLRQRFG
jgi:glucosamine kinase